MAEPKTINYFKDNYYDNIGQLCDVPDPNIKDDNGDMKESRTWYDWMMNEGKKIDNFDLTKLLPSGDLREKIRANNSYLFKVYLQSQVELMTEGKRSVKIMTEESRIAEDIQYNKKMKELTSIFNDTLNSFFSDKKDKKLVHGNGLPPEEGCYDLTLSDLELLFDKTRGKENDVDLISSISHNSIRILIRDSREKSIMMREDLLTNSSADSNDRETCLIEQNFYTALSEYIEKILKIGFETEVARKEQEEKDRKEEADDEPKEEDYEPKAIEGTVLSAINHSNLSIEDLFKSKIPEMPDENKRERSFKRVSRILSLLITSILYSDDLIIRKSGSFDDFLLHKAIDKETLKSEKKQIGQYKNMIYFSDKLKDKIGYDSLGGQHPIFRVLRSHTHRYMYCLPEDHIVNISEEVSRVSSPSLGGYINPNSSVSFTVSNEKRLSKIIGKKRFDYNDETLKSLNILQKTQWEANIDFLSFITEGIKDRDNDRRFVDVTSVKEIFKRSFYYPIGRKICGNPVCSDSDNNVCLECLRLRDNNILENTERDKRFIWITRILNHNANVFWHSWAFDWRGRLIVRAPVLSPQKSDIDRALIRFKEWKKLDDTGWYWFRIFLFDLLVDPHTDLFTEPPKKIFSNEHKIKWIDSNEDKLIMLVKNLHENESYQIYLQLKDSPKPKSETFQRISALLEYKRLIEKSKKENTDVINLKSGHPVHFDASSNGYQHLSMLTNNVELAKKVNVFSSTSGGKSSKNDLYLEVAKNAKDNWNEDRSQLKKYLSGLNQLNKSQLEEICELVFSRSMSKLPTMTHIYGAKDLTYELNFIGKNGKGRPGYTKNSNENELPSYFVRWHYESPIYLAMKKFDENNDDILLGTNGIFFHEKLASEEEMRVYNKSSSTLKQSIFIHCLIKDYKTSIDEVTGNSYRELKESLKLVIKKLNEKEDDGNRNTNTISWRLDDGSKVENYYPTKKITQQLDTTTTLGLLNSPIFANLSMSKSSLLDYFNENISKDFLDDKFIEDALRKYSIRKSKEKEDELIDNLKKKLYSNSDNNNHLPWKIYSYRIDMINDLEDFHLRLKKIGNRSKGDLSSAHSRKKRAEKKDNREKVLLERKKIKELVKEKEKLEKSKNKLISNINKKPNQNENEELFREKKVGEHNYWKSISSFIKLKRIENPQGYQNPIDFLRAIMEHLFETLSDEEIGYNRMDNELLENWKRACNLTITCNFIDYLKDVDSNKINSSIAPNFIHSLDAFHMRSSIIKFREEFREEFGDNYHPSIWAVHDSFGTHACDIEKYMRIIKESFLQMHKKKDLLAHCIQICRSAGILDSETALKDLKDEIKKIIQLDEEIRKVREDFRKELGKTDVKKLLNKSVGQIPKMSDYFLS